jgi:starch-binding outer membrane protein, SusD/RagB family
MKTHTILFCIVAGALLACRPDLDLAPRDQITTSTFYRNESDALSALNAAYRPLQNMYGNQFDAETILTPNAVAADEGVPFLQGNANRIALWSYTFIPENSFTANIWGFSYQAIQRSNVVIQRVPGIPMDEELKKRIIAEARFLRAFHYFNLVRFYGGVPLVADETTTLTGLQVPRATVAEVYAFIVDDLSMAENDLPLMYPASEAGRATRGAAKGLLAKVYLTRAGNAASPDWELAAAKAKEVMDLGIYDLYEDYAEAFEVSSRGGRENVFEITYVRDVLGQSHATYWAPRGAPIVPSNGYGTIRVSRSLWDSFLPEDKRRDASFLRSYVHPGTGQVVELSVDNPDFVNAVSFWKLADLSSLVFSGGEKSFPYMRFAEILLIYAEALNEAAGPTAEAYAALNRVRTRAGFTTPVEGLSQSQFRDLVLQERRLELNFEGHRWFDLVRRERLLDAVRAETSFNRSPQIQPYHILFPVPQREIDINEALNQNPGY